MSLIKNVGVLTLGQFVSQVVNLLGYAVLARLYTPNQFGTYAIFTGVVSIVSIVASGRYEITILLPRCELHAKIAARVSLFLSLSLHTLVLLLSAALVILEKIETQWMILAFVSLFSSIINILSFFQNRKKKYGEISMTLVLRSILFIITSWSLVFVSSSQINLIYAHALSTALACIFVLILNRRYLFNLSFNKVKLLVWIRKYKDFIKFSSPAVLVSAFSGQTPIFLLSFFWGDHASGFYSMLQRIMLAPVRLIANSVNRVYLQRISELKHNKSSLWKFTKILIFRISILGSVMCLIIFVIIEINLITLIFGEKWISLNEYATIMLPFFLLSFVTSAIAGFSVLDKNRTGFFYQLLLFSVLSLSIISSNFLSGSIRDVYVTISITTSIIYICQIITIIFATKSVDKTFQYA